MSKTGLSSLPPSKRKLAKIYRALANPVRFQIMETLAVNQVQCPADLIKSTKLAPSTISQHLKVLLDAGLIQVEIQGPSSHFSINSDGIAWFKNQVKHWLPDYSLPFGED